MKNQKFIIALTCALLLVIPLCSKSVCAAGPHWEAVPEVLKHSPGVQTKGGRIYATGQATVPHIREDKAYELAREKSFNRSAQWIRFGGSCSSLFQSLPEKDRPGFYDVFVFHMPAVHVKHLETLRQWEDQDEILTSVAAPVQDISVVECPFADIKEVLYQYAEQPQVSLTGLRFCLRHSCRYTTLASNIQSKAAQYFRDNGLFALAGCFSTDNTWKASYSPLIMQHQINLAASYSKKARKFTSKGNWKKALAAAENALAILPSHSPSYLILGKYLLHEKDQPEFALAASQKALRDGACFKEALKLNIACLNRLNSQEAQIFQYLLKKIGTMEYPAQLDIRPGSQKGVTAADVVINSAGCAFEGPDKKADPLFDQAVNLFQKAESDADVQNVLSLLVEAVNRQPVSAKTHNLLGACLRHLEQPLLAVPFLWQAARLKPGYDLALTNLGICCSILKQRKSASYYFNHPAVVESKNKWVRKQLNDFKKQ